MVEGLWAGACWVRDAHEVARRDSATGSREDKAFLRTGPCPSRASACAPSEAYGTGHAQRVTAYIGYLPDALATKYAGIELAIHSSKVCLPLTANQPVRLKIALLMRSARTLTRQQCT